MAQIRVFSPGKVLNGDEKSNSALPRFWFDGAVLFLKLVETDFCVFVF